MQVHQRFEVDFLILFDSLPFIGRELEAISSDALLDPLVENSFPIYYQNVCPILLTSFLQALL